MAGHNAASLSKSCTLDRTVSYKLCLVFLSFVFGMAGIDVQAGSPVPRSASFGFYMHANQPALFPIVLF